MSFGALSAYSIKKVLRVTVGGAVKERGKAARKGDGRYFTSFQCIPAEHDYPPVGQLPNTSHNLPPRHPPSMPTHKLTPLCGQIHPPCTCALR